MRVGKRGRVVGWKRVGKGLRMGRVGKGVRERKDGRVEDGERVEGGVGKRGS